MTVYNVDIEIPLSDVTGDFVPLTLEQTRNIRKAKVDKLIVKFLADDLLFCFFVFFLYPGAGSTDEKNDDWCLIIGQQQDFLLLHHFQTEILLYSF